MPRAREVTVISQMTVTWAFSAIAGVVSAWEQRKLEARKMLDAKRAAESPASSA